MMSTTSVSSMAVINVYLYVFAISIHLIPLLRNTLSFRFPCTLNSWNGLNQAKRTVPAPSNGNRSMTQKDSMDSISSDEVYRTQSFTSWGKRDNIL